MVHIQSMFFLFVAMVTFLFGGAAAQADDFYFMESDGIVSMEAENYSRNQGYVFSDSSTINTGVRVMPAEGFSGQGYMASNNAGVKISYDIEFTKTGAYYVNLRSWSDLEDYSGSHQNGYCAQFDGSALVGACPDYGLYVLKRARWEWVTKEQYVWSPPVGGAVTLNVNAPGKHTFSLSPKKEKTVWFDKIVLIHTSLCNNVNFDGCSTGTGPAESERTDGPKGAAPTATTGPASLIASTRATLNGTVNANDALSTVDFEYGTTTNYGNTVSAAQSPVSGTSDVDVSGEITGVSPATTYHYRVKAVNDYGTGIGDDQTFLTTCSGDAVVIQNVTFVAGTTTECVGSASITIGPGVTIEDNANVTFKAPIVTGTDTVNIVEGAEVRIIQ